MTETLKAESRQLRGTILDELQSNDLAFTADAGQLLKFHGIYQQDDRDLRRGLTQAKEALAYSCMVRCSVPGGVLSPEQWLTIDALADRFADGALRLTSRQGVQFHFVHKGELQSLIRGLSEGLVSTYAACGDVVRNVMASNAPIEGVDHARIEALANSIDARFTPQSAAYWELWIDGEKAVSAGPVASFPQQIGEEPIYGESYLPRKFKIGIAWTGDNSVDVYSQDCAIVPLDRMDDDGSAVPGAVILAGGGLGRSHNNPATFPHLAQPLGWVQDGQIGDVVEAIVTVFRDFGDRENRKHARLKYLVAERGIDWLRSEVEQRLGASIEYPVELPAWGRSRGSLGWHQQPDGRWFLGVPIPGGRLTDSESQASRTAVRLCLETYADEIRLTPHHDLLLCGVLEEHKEAVESVLTGHGVSLVQHLSLSVVSAMACPALPTCGQALGEAERVLPEVTDLLDQLLTARGLSEVAIETRMTGCPNGCSRPYVAELGIVGRTKTTYDLWLGGSPDGSRLATETLEAVPLTKLGDVLGPLLDRYRNERDDESFGDWAHAVGTEGLLVGLPTFRIPGAS
jgi:sulfite reductase (ferredoxin)